LTFKPIKAYTLFKTISPSRWLLIEQFWSLYITHICYLQNSFTRFYLFLFFNFFDLEVIGSRINLPFILFFFQKHFLYELANLVDIVVIDFPGKKMRFKVCYLLSSYRYNLRLRISIYTKELLFIPTICQFFNSALWLEREIWDMYGILILNHSDMRRILTDYGFTGFPLRKDFPLTGFFEIYYSDQKQCIIQRRVSLAQAYRYYEFRNPWIKI
jgi:NADH:ubiquinone oxidoreductase subunit C